MTDRVIVKERDDYKYYRVALEANCSLRNEEEIEDKEIELQLFNAMLDQMVQWGRELFKKEGK